MTKIILDLDTGIDDAMALAYALGHKDAEVLAVTSIYGNVETDQAAKNASAILKLLGREDIPVYIGAKGALEADGDYVQEEASGRIHGKNGIANVELETGSNIVEDQDAVDYLIEQADKLGEDLTIVSTGPLTNIALAFEKNPEAMGKIKELVAMGGALTVPGNVSPFAEANFNKDSKANNIVFQSGIKITMIGLDVTLRTLLTIDDIDSWKQGSDAAKNMYEIVTYYFKAYEDQYEDLAGCALHDPLAVSVALDKDWVEGAQFNVQSLYGEQEGRIVQDHAARNEGKDRNVRVALEVDGPKYTEHFVKTINKAL